MKRKQNPISLLNGNMLPRMTFLETFMNNLHITREAAARAVGKTPITVGRWFKPGIDNCYVSEAEAVCSQFGYSLLISFSSTPLELYQTIDEGLGGRTEVLVRNPQGMMSIPRGWKNKDARAGIQQNKSPRLQFIMDALARAQLSRTEFAKKMGLSTPAIDHMFRYDDVRISRVYEIASRLNTSVRFTITPMPNLMDKDRNWCVIDVKLVTPI